MIQLGKGCQVVELLPTPSYPHTFKKLKSHQTLLLKYVHLRSEILTKPFEEM
jgi:hypothetical protein